MDFVSINYCFFLLLLALIVTVIRRDHNLFVIDLNISMSLREELFVFCILFPRYKTIPKSN